jgi:hypothetical protein
MMSFFMNPWTMVAGGALVLTPIIIHLINRMRFRRVKWAAMEFLLKAQKKMRRKKILEQLLLLLLRCLLVFLAGLLFARFLGFEPTGKETHPVLHVVVLDDTPSMADAGEGNAAGDVFTIAKAQITDKIMVAATKASTPQRLRIIRLSDLSDIVNPGSGSTAEPELINSKLIENVKASLASMKPETVHVGLAEGLKKAKQFLDQPTGVEVTKIVHVISDMRDQDWTTDGEAIAAATKELTDAGAKIHLVDVATPFRTKERKSPVYSDNVGIVELKPRTRVSAKDKPVEFDIRIKNFGNTTLQNVVVKCFLNGESRLLTTLNFETVPANQEQSQSFVVSPSRTATREDPLARFNVVSCMLQKTGSDALAFDNARHAIVEVRDRLSVLAIVRPEELANPDDKNGDTLFLRNLLETKFTDLEWNAATPDALVKRDLKEYGSIYLLNVPGLTDAETAALERYIKGGGGVGVFLGDKVVPDIYKKNMYRDGAGFFPVPLPNEPTKEMTREERDKWDKSFAKRVLLRDPAVKSHPALRGIYGESIIKRSEKETADQIERSFWYAGIFRHWPIARIGRWREDKSIQELYCLPNDTPITEFEGKAVELIKAINAEYGEPKFAKYRDKVDPILARIRDLTGDKENPALVRLAAQMDRLLADQISEGDADEALLREFWGQPEMAKAKALATSLRDSAKYGDPLYFARSYGDEKSGMGRVAVFTIPTGGPWTDWPARNAGAISWSALMYEMQNYLRGGGAEENRTVGSPLETTFETGRYKPSVEWTYLTYDVAKPDAATQNAPMIREPVLGQTQKTFPLDTKEGSLRLNFPDTKRPGVYLFTLTWQKRESDPPGAPATKPEYMAAVFNPDTEREGNLRRANTDNFTSAARGAELHTPDEDYERTFEQRPTDMSSGKWIYLLILLILIFEQALAVRLSYHTKTDDLAAFAPSAAAAMAGRSVAQEAGEGAAPNGGTGDAGNGPGA